MPMDVADTAWWFHWGAVECLSGQTRTGLFRLTAACWAHRATLNRAAAGHLHHPSFLQPGRKTQIHFKHTQPHLRGRATFLLTAATLEWITKPIWVAQKGAHWLLLSKWWHLFAFTCLCVCVGKFNFQISDQFACDAKYSPCWPSSYHSLNLNLSFLLIMPCPIIPFSSWSMKQHIHPAHMLL